ncbi:MAG: molecular chaperone HtpG [Tenuifilaceae bacterium]|mgnify:FL=1|jgi:molecular chaperone HtpG|nr:molecular chaperone HtpG [Bacteroidales bacterium]MDI9515655.1 molecular chaperone HtpG [Bacteroidota bacterium]NLH55905.1 molecular chaperone HtpG [Rikenellaceae bacterium]OQC63258.1 MAG: Chaperone protein HtpG [Bacteroidetes bacterium ADurb.Bin008]HNV81262.1 molecular chaperone HtpG [Tenuifilaceae bacterium]
MQKGKIDVTSENIFPIIKKFLYSDHEIFLRELISNAVDATQKLKALASVGDFKGELGDVTIRVKLDKKAKTITVSDSGIGMTAEEIDKYINQIAFSGAEEFLEKYKDKTDAIIGHFGLGFYSSFMVSSKVEIVTRSYREDAKPVKWTCEGNPEFTIEDSTREGRGTDIILHINDESKEFLEESRINEMLKKYCRFLPIPIAFGTIKEWKDGKEVDTGKDKIVNETNPLWTRKPADLKDEDYQAFYKDLYPASEDPLFNIHLNVDYPFNLTGILYFPKIKSNFDIQKNKIQLFCNQVYVTDSVEGIVPEFLTLLHGVIDSPDIPLNVSRSYLQSDSNVKKISSHITKKVADRLQEIFKNDRDQFEKKWDDLKLFINYGMITDEKFYERAEKFAMFKNTEGKYFTYDEYEKLIKENQTDKNKSLIYLYASDVEEQYTYIDGAKNRGYDVLIMDGQLDPHLINHLESKFKDSRFVRVDSDVIDKLIMKDDKKELTLSYEEQGELRNVFEGAGGESGKFWVQFEEMGAEAAPVVITRSEFIRRMKDMSAMSGLSGYYGSMPDIVNLVVNVSHPLVKSVIEQKDQDLAAKIAELKAQAEPLQKDLDGMKKANEKKKEEEIPQADKDKMDELEKSIQELNSQKESALKDFGKDHALTKQLIDLALLANNMLKGEELSKFVKRSVELIKPKSKKK